jgi:hypothetical protein
VTETLIGGVGWCAQHGKLLHPSRKAAKRACRQLHSPGLREYRCAGVDGYWHVGHLPPPVRRGERTMRDGRPGGAA